MPSPLRSEAELLELAETLEAAVLHKQYGGQIWSFDPYPRQKDFFDLGATKRERVLFGGNQSGKSSTGAYEAGCHATGIYPSWWNGKRFDRPTRGWICGESAEVLREVSQTKLFGMFGQEDAWGSGMIPRDRLIGRTLVRGTSEYYDTVQIRHISGGVSTISAKSYQQGREKMQGATLDWAWLDEEPSLEVYSEILTRIAATNGIVFMTYTALKGPTLLTNRFIDEPSSNRELVYLSLDDAKHMTPERKRELWDSWPPHERESRFYGKPHMGQGAIFKTPEDMVLEPAITEIPPFWAKIWGIDIGIGHPFGAVLLLWDRDNDVIHVHHTIRMADALPVAHANAMKPIGADVPVAWPKDAGDRDRGSGHPIIKLYGAEGLKVLSHHAQWEDGSVSTWAGITEWDQRERGGRLKIASHLTEFREERRGYHMKDNQIVKIKDDLLSACRIGLMMKRFARPVQLGGRRGTAAPRSNFARGSSGHPDGGMNPFTGGAA